MFLTPQERDKFATYLEQHARDSSQQVEQMKRLPGAFPTAMVELVRNDAIAYSFVAARLRTVEEQVIGENQGR